VSVIIIDEIWLIIDGRIDYRLELNHGFLRQVRFPFPVLPSLRLEAHIRLLHSNLPQSHIPKLASIWQPVCPSRSAH
jgi:hypothetical protein